MIVNASRLLTKATVTMESGARQLARKFAPAAAVPKIRPRHLHGEFLAVESRQRQPRDRRAGQLGLLENGSGGFLQINQLPPEKFRILRHHPAIFRRIVRQLPDDVRVPAIRQSPLHRGAFKRHGKRARLKIGIVRQDRRRGHRRIHPVGHGWSWRRTGRARLRWATG